MYRSLYIARMAALLGLVVVLFGALQVRSIFNKEYVKYCILISCVTRHISWHTTNFHISNYGMKKDKPYNKINGSRREMLQIFFSAQ